MSTRNVRVNIMLVKELTRKLFAAAPNPVIVDNPAIIQQRRTYDNVHAETEERTRRSCIALFNNLMSKP
jgi:hypothetical protein